MTARAQSERLQMPQDDESLFQHIARSTKNFFVAAFGCIQTSDEKAKIKYKQYLMETRKKAFGVAYIDLVRKDATAAELDNCVKACTQDLEVIEKEIATLNEEVQKVTSATKEKIVKAPAKASAAGSTVTTAVPASSPAPPPATPATANAVPSADPATANAAPAASETPAAKVEDSSPTEAVASPTTETPTAAT